MTAAEFLVEISFRAADVPEHLREAILTAERARGRQLRGAGILERIWRLPGGASSVGVWRADGASELHELLSSLPISPWCRFAVTALAPHPLERETEHDD